MNPHHTFDSLTPPPDRLDILAVYLRDTITNELSTRVGEKGHAIQNFKVGGFTVTFTLAVY